MSMSLDGYIAGPDDGPGNPGGDGFGRLHEWIPDGETVRSPGPAGQLIGEMEATGAVRAAYRGTGRSLQWPSPRRADLRAQPPAAVSLGGQLPAGDVRGRRHRQCHGAGEGRRRGPRRAGAWRVHGAAALEAGVLDELQIHPWVPKTRATWPDALLAAGHSAPCQAHARPVLACRGVR
jgi:hypothetical protein